MAESRSASSLNKTSQDIADKVNDSLPVRLSAQDVQQYPEFIKLLLAVSQYLRSDGTSTGIHTDRQQAEECMRQAKSRWLQNHILYTELQELLLEHEMQAAQSTSSNNQFYKAAQECLTYAELGDYLHCNPDPSSTLTLFGLKREDVDSKNPHRKHLQSIQQKLIPELESQLRKKCETVVNFHEPPREDNADDRLAFAKASQLPARLEEQKRTLEEETRRLRQDRHRRDKQFYQYYQALMDSLNTLEQMIRRHRLHSQSENDTVTSEWLAARCDVMCLKIKMLELQLLCDTYYADTVQALSRVKHELDGAVKSTQKEINQVGQALKAYDAVGMGFDTIVKEYTYLRDEIENKCWALRELKHTLQKE